ncbi:MAG: nucleotide exchange factor GrpE [Magnetococcales bacterium]|nr:nucleotide exchange factor GrpE [Magnetococcales bacterium]
MEEKKALLLEQFRILLDRADAEGHFLQEDAPDLQALFVELAALKNEVRIESRQLKAALDQFRQVFDLVDGSQKSLQRELDGAREKEQGHLRALTRGWLLEMLEIRDRLEAGLAALESHRLPRLSQWLYPREVAWLTGMREGQTLLLKRLDAQLAARQVQAIQAIGKVLDPHCMQAVATSWQEALPEGVVTEEARKGFHWGSEVLRLAEVKVNQQTGTQHD